MSSPASDPPVPSPRATDLPPVLVVDDEYGPREAIAFSLAAEFAVETAARGRIALDLIRGKAFAAVVLDIRMPEMDGREATRRIRAGGGPNAGVPIIAVTADTAPDDIAACTEAGMTYFVSKPITPPMLLGAVTHVMTLAQADEVPEAETVAA